MNIEKGLASTQSYYFSSFFRTISLLLHCLFQYYKKVVIIVVAFFRERGKKCNKNNILLEDRNFGQINEKFFNYVYNKIIKCSLIISYHIEFFFLNVISEIYRLRNLGLRKDLI